MLPNDGVDTYHLFIFQSNNIIYLRRNTCIVLVSYNTALSLNRNIIIILKIFPHGQK